jgi:NTP pyrophosphatase (non-canonical NTP hydrolase)
MLRAMDRLAMTLAEIRSFVEEREWEPFHDPKNLAMAVASEAGELVAELRWVKSDEADEFCRDPANRARVADEIADVAITLLMMADRIGLDVIECMQKKLVKNAGKYPVERARGRPESP